MKDPRRTKFKTPNVKEESEYTKAEARAFGKAALRLLEKEPKHAKAAFSKLIAVVMCGVGVNEYEVAYKLGRKVEWVNRVYKKHLSGKSDWMDLIDKRVMNGRDRDKPSRRRLLVSKENTLLSRYLELYNKLLDCEGKPRKFNAHGIPIGLTDPKQSSFE